MSFTQLNFVAANAANFVAGTYFMLDMIFETVLSKEQAVASGTFECR
jgi:hypothetical protein